MDRGRGERVTLGACRTALRRVKMSADRRGIVVDVYGLRRPLALLSVIQAAAEHSESWMAMAVHAVLGWSHKQSGHREGMRSSPLVGRKICRSARQCNAA